MAFDTVHQTIVDRVEANKGSVIVEYPNAEAVTPTDGPFMRLTIIPGETRPIEMGGTKTYRQVGVVVLQLLDKTGKGEGRLLELADTMKIVFRSVIDGSVVFRSPSISRVGPVDDGWYQINLTCPYHSDEQGA